MATGKQHEQRPTKTQPTPRGTSQPRPPSQWKAVQETLTDIQSTFGFVPDFMNFLTDQALVGAWSEAKTLYFNPQTSLEPKLKNLISLAVSSQIPCDMMSYFEHGTSLANGATAKQQAEAVQMAALTRHWSTVLNGSQIDKDTFRKEADQIMSYVKRMMEQSGMKAPAEENFLVQFSTPAETYKDIERFMGLVPKFFLAFPEEGISGAWSAFKGLQLNPYTALNGKQKELIGLAVSSQIPCDYCVYFHRNAARLNGATDREMQEAVAIGALSRHWSAIFHGGSSDLSSFKATADRMIEKIGIGRPGLPS